VGVQRQELVRAASLARISLTEAEALRLTLELSGILEQLERLLAVPFLPGREAPLALPPAEAGRSDEPGADPLEQELPRLAPEWQAGYFTVPRVLTP